jgi:PAS domain S-box-containing protein
MKDQKKSTAELIKELEDLKRENRSLRSAVLKGSLELRDAGEKLRESEERFRLFFQNAPLGYQSLDINGNFIAVNEAWLETLGYKRDEVIGKWFGDFLAPRFKEVFRERFPVFKAKGKIHSEFEMIHKDGHLLSIAFDGRIGKETDGTFIQTHCILKDISETRLAETSLKESEQRLRDIIFSIADWVWEVDENGVYTFSSQKGSELFGARQEYIIGKTPFDFMEPEEAERVGGIFSQIVAEKRSFRDLENWNINSKGERFCLLTNGVPVLDAEGNLKGYRGVDKDITERKNVEENLAQQKLFYEQMFMQSSVSTQILDREGWCERINPKLSQIFGVQPQDIEGKVYNIFKDEAIIQGGIVPHLEKVFNEGKTSEWEVFFDIGLAAESQNIKVKKKKKVWYSNWAYPIFDEKGKVSHVIIQHTDITDRKQAEDALRESKEQFSSAFEFAGIGMALVSTREVFIKVNQTLSDLLGYQVKDLTKMALDEIAHPVDLQNVRTQVRELLAGRINTYHGEMRLLSKQGSLVWVLMSVSLVRDDHDLPQYFIAQFQDITDRKRAETIQQIQLNITRKVVLSESLWQLVEAVREELGRLLDTSGLFVALYNRATDSLRQILYIDQEKQIDEWKSSNSIYGQVIKQARTMLLTKTGLMDLVVARNLEMPVTIPECWLGVPLIIEKQAVGIIAIQSSTDPDAFDQTSCDLMEMVAREISLYVDRENMIDDLVVARKRAEESDRLKSAFLANMSHEIRTPLNSIIGFSDLLTEDDNDLDDIKKFASVIQASGNRLLQLISNLIDISKIESGTEHVRYSQLSPVQTIQEVVSQFRLMAEGKSIKILEYFKPIQTNMLIMTDSLKLHQILTNLINNALKFTQIGTIEVGLEERPDGVLFFVKDTGIGIPIDQLDRVFDRFFQAYPTMTHPTEGAGLGLSLCKSMVELLGGRIWVESKVGQGSTFSFFLPN